MDDSSYDRFSSKEDHEWNPIAFNAGHLARTLGLDMGVNPYTMGSCKYDAWRAGWCDADQGIAADLESEKA